jgi:hypothetical protein
MSGGRLPLNFTLFVHNYQPGSRRSAVRRYQPGNRCSASGATNPGSAPDWH